MKIIIFGAGRIGRALCLDLALNPELDLTVVDINKKAIDKIAQNLKVKGVVADVLEKQTVFELLAGKDLAVNALPGKMGFDLLKNVIEAGVDEVDVSFFSQNPLPYDSLAKAKNLKILVDCGLAPGLSNLLVGRAYKEMEVVDSIKIYVGGLPKERKLPWEFYSFFSPEDIIEEYIRPARFKINNQLEVKPALSDVEYLDFQGIGTLEAFLTDGLRTLVDTLEIPNMVEKTLRYPGHQEKIKFLQGLGLFDPGEVEVGGS